MTIKNLIYTIPLPDEMYESSIDSFARATGWDETSEHTKLEHCRRWLNATVNKHITDFNADMAAQAAREAAQAQVSAALDTITTTLVVE